MRRIGVLTSDFSLYHDLLRALRERGLPFASLAFGERPGGDIGVILTSWKDAVGTRLPEDVPVVAVPLDAEGKEDIHAALVKAQHVLEGVEGHVEVAIGIDPGERPGIALVADGRLLYTGQVFRVSDVARTVGSLFAQYPHERGVARVGHGAPHERDRILADLWPMREEGVRIELVDETDTTPETGASEWSSDVAAAIAIARTTGTELVRRPRTPIKRGRVREVQHASRSTSEGRVTLSREEARRVARGEKTVDEALREREEQARRLKAKRSRPGSP